MSDVRVLNWISLNHKAIEALASGEAAVVRLLGKDGDVCIYCGDAHYFFGEPRDRIDEPLSDENGEPVS